LGQDFLLVSVSQSSHPYSPHTALWVRTEPP
jgi:hypothetical protein